MTTTMKPPAWFWAVTVLLVLWEATGLLRLWHADQARRGRDGSVIVMFDYAFAATDLIAHKGLAQVLPFPLFNAAVGAFSIWFAGFAARKGWIG